jgi:hypothetical protein
MFIHADVKTHKTSDTRASSPLNTPWFKLNPVFIFTIIPVPFLQSSLFHFYNHPCSIFTIIPVPFLQSSLFLLDCYRCIFHGTGNSAHLCQNVNFRGVLNPTNCTPPPHTPLQYNGMDWYNDSFLQLLCVSHKTTWVKVPRFCIRNIRELSDTQRKQGEHKRTYTTYSVHKQTNLHNILCILSTNTTVYTNQTSP